MWEHCNVTEITAPLELSQIIVCSSVVESCFQQWVLFNVFVKLQWVPAVQTCLTMFNVIGPRTQKDTGLVPVIITDVPEITVVRSRVSLTGWVFVVSSIVGISCQLGPISVKIWHLYHYGDFCGDMLIIRLTYHFKGIPYTAKVVSL